MPEIALASKRTESGNVVRTHDAPDVFLFAARALGTEAAAVQLAFTAFHFWRNVDVQALLCRIAEPKRGIEATLGHFAQVILVQIVACIALLAKATQPVLAHSAPEKIAALCDSRRGRRLFVAQWAPWAKITAPGRESWTDINVRRQRNAKFLLDKRFERELSVLPVALCREAPLAWA